MFDARGYLAASVVGASQPSGGRAGRSVRKTIVPRLAWRLETAATFAKPTFVGWGV